MAFIDDFKSRFPEFSVGNVNLYIPTLETVYPCYYGGDYAVACDKEIILNLVAHLLVSEINTASSATYPESSRSVGSVSQSFNNGTISQGKTFLMATKYGQKYLFLTSRNSGAIFV